MQCGHAVLQYEVGSGRKEFDDLQQQSWTAELAASGAKCNMLPREMRSLPLAYRTRIFFIGTSTCSNKYSNFMRIRHTLWTKILVWTHKRVLYLGAPYIWTKFRNLPTPGRVPYNPVRFLLMKLLYFSFFSAICTLLVWLGWFLCLRLPDLLSKCFWYLQRPLNKTKKVEHLF